jgi:hypothetical protein
MRKAGIAVGPLLDLARQEIIGLARPPDGDRGVALALHARPGNGQNGARDACAIHRLEAHFSEIRQARKEAAGDCGINAADRSAPIAVEAGTQEMLLERDLADHVSTRPPAFSLAPLAVAHPAVPHGGDAVSNRKSGSKAAAKRRERA